MAKQRLKIEDLTNLVLDRIRQCRQGRHVLEISIYELESRHLGRNWDITIVSPGKCGMAAARRAACSVVAELGPQFDLSVETETYIDVGSEAETAFRQAAARDPVTGAGRPVSTPQLAPPHSTARAIVAWLIDYLPRL